jgi:hypothetical protein
MDVLVQPCMTEVESHGEWSIVFFRGQYSHAVRKRPAPGDFRVQPRFGGYVEAAVPSSDLVGQAAAILSATDADLLYARIDGIERDGRFILMELEVHEPNLDLGCSSGAADRFAHAVETLL